MRRVAIFGDAVLTYTSGDGFNTLTLGNSSAGVVIYIH